MPVHVMQIAQHADDLERAVAFYEAHFGAERIATFDPPGLAFVRLGDVRVLFERSAPTATLYLDVPDARQALEEARAAGVQVETEAHAIYADDDGLFGAAGTAEWQSFVRDSEGNLVGFVSRHPHATS